mmetsp:Transcript_9878/g.24658  ORF Transcript_9878/g.24658 Transcript_9878/m.24658 type:complete len:470 (-) Transcript_9878:14-1423(-)
MIFDFELHGVRVGLEVVEDAEGGNNALPTLLVLGLSGCHASAGLALCVRIGIVIVPVLVPIHIRLPRHGNVLLLGLVVTDRLALLGAHAGHQLVLLLGPAGRLLGRLGCVTDLNRLANFDDDFGGLHGLVHFLGERANKVLHGGRHRCLVISKLFLQPFSRLQVDGDAVHPHILLLPKLHSLAHGVVGHDVIPFHQHEPARHRCGRCGRVGVRPHAHRHGRRFDVRRRAHEDLAQSRDAQRQVHVSASRKMEGVQRHLRGGLPYRLRGQQPHRLARLHDAVKKLEEEQRLELLLLECVLHFQDRLLAALALLLKIPVWVGFLVLVHLPLQFFGNTAKVVCRVVSGHGSFGQGVLECPFHVLHCRLGVHEVDQRARLVLVDEPEVVARQKPKLVHKFGPPNVQTVLAVVELHHRAVRVAHSVVVVHAQALQLLDEAALQVPAAGRLHGRVDEALTASHTMEVELLRANAR